MKKPKKSEAGSLFGSIKQTPAPIQEPLKTEKFHSADGERMTRVTYRLNPNPVEVSADQLMKAASEMPSVLMQHAFCGYRATIRCAAEFNESTSFGFWNYLGRLFNPFEKKFTAQHTVQ